MLYGILPLSAGALAATLTELHEPFGINDNLTIPIFSSLAMQWAFSRIQGCVRICDSGEEDQGVGGQILSRSCESSTWKGIAATDPAHFVVISRLMSVGVGGRVKALPNTPMSTT